MVFYCFLYLVRIEHSQRREENSYKNFPPSAYPTVKKKKVSFLLLAMADFGGRSSKDLEKPTIEHLIHSTGWVRTQYKYCPVRGLLYSYSSRRLSTPLSEIVLDRIFDARTT